MKVWDTFGGSEMWNTKAFFKGTVWGLKFGLENIIWTKQVQVKANTINKHGQQHWPPPLDSTTGRHHWPGSFATCSKHVDDDDDHDDDADDMITC